ncbi:MAG: 3-deoxy-D-manno-octulosonic acid transferase [Candidatus Omnitrophica bacterium]|nr:3-deoxy-D-manno-octulosonic acid transferase [Candidatus Omnitrophota bacterium]
MMFLLYDLIFIIFVIVYLPYFLLRKKFHRGFVQRLGVLPTSLELDRPIWIHAVSVGEAKAAEILVKQLRQVYPKKKFILSTVTTTGNKIVHSFRSQDDFVFYLPLDLSFITKGTIRRLRPCVCIIMETEIWPNLITQLNKMGVPVILVNARISDRSFLGYRMIKPLLKPILNKINIFCVQSERDAQRLSVLGVSSNKLQITGNMKFDFKDYTPACPASPAGGRQAGIFERDSTDYKLKLGLESEEKLFVAGSTHQGEEEIILKTYKKLLDDFPNLRLLIAPRHLERSAKVEKLIRKYGFLCIRFSQSNLLSISPSSRPVFILDTIGQLLSFFAIADIVFVGGSLVKRGGHNILEPAYFSKPILFGPYMFNFRDIGDLFLAEGAARMVCGQTGLLEEIRFLLSNPSELKAMSNRARQLVLDNQGATERNVQRISLFIGHG